MNARASVSEPNRSGKVGRYFRVLNSRDAMDPEDLLHHLLGQHPGLMGVDVHADDVAGVDVDHHVGVVVDAPGWTGELGDVAGVDLPGPVATSSGTARAGWRASRRRSLSWPASARIRYIVETEHKYSPRLSRVA